VPAPTSDDHLDGSRAGPGHRPLTAGGRARRLVAVTLVGLVLLAGTAVGSDDWFPLGPFRMYTNEAGPTGIVRVVTIHAVDADGRALQVEERDVGLRRAEYEGQLHRFRDDPTLLGAIADAYASVHPDRPPLVELRLDEEVRRVADRIVQPDVERRTVAEWQAT
jgi:hypothetical protein